MDAAELTRALKLAAAIVVALTAVGVIIGAAIPALGGTTPPHPTLDGTTSEALSILASNLRVLAVPFLLWLLRFAASRPGRAIGDVITAAMAALSAVIVGIALGSWRGRLIPYLPQLPLEWGALTVAVATWLLARAGRVHTPQMLALGSTVAVLLCSAAVVETWATPHRRPATPARRAVRPDLPARAGRLIEPSDCASARLPGAAACPSTTAVAALVRRPDRRHINHRPPGGITT
jgi:hypothetical protein